MPDPDVTAALKYTGDGAPKVVAAGKGHIAAQILVRAREAGVPVHQDPELATALTQLAMGQEIPDADVDRRGAGAGLGLRLVRKAPYSKSVMKKLGSAPDTDCVRQSVSPSQEFSTRHEVHDVLRQPQARKR